MSRVSFPVLAAMTAVALAVSFPVSAQNESPGMGNGKNMPSFADFDLDGDGSVSAEEFAAHQAGHRRQSHSY